MFDNPTLKERLCFLSPFNYKGMVKTTTLEQDLPEPTLLKVKDTVFIA